MSHMVSSNQKSLFPKINHLKNLVIVFGVCLGLFTISSCNNWLSSTETLIAREIRELEDCKSRETSNDIDELQIAKLEPKLKTHHNFIASYLLQESCFERNNKKPNEQVGFLRYLKDLHKIILAQTVGSF